MKAEATKTTTVVSVMYEAVSIDRQPEDEDPDYKDLKEKMIHKFKGKLYTMAEVIQMGKILEVDTRKAFQWQQRTWPRAPDQADVNRQCVQHS